MRSESADSFCAVKSKSGTATVVQSQTQALTQFVELLQEV